MSVSTEDRELAGGHIGAAEGGHLSFSGGRVLRAAGARLPYTAGLTRANGFDLHQSFPTMRDAESFIRRKTPVPAPALSASYDQPADRDH